MPAASSTLATPSLSQIVAWDVEHLESAADNWSDAAQAWDDAFSAVFREAVSPGGTEWNGDAADAAVQRVGADRLTVPGAVDDLRIAAQVARTSASDLRMAREVVLDAVAAARGAGFSVGDDLSVRSRVIGGSPQLQSALRAQAEVLAATIRSRAAALGALDQQVAGRITAAAAGLSALNFKTDGAGVPAERDSSGIQAVNFTNRPERPIPGPGDPANPSGGTALTAGDVGA